MLPFLAISIQNKGLGDTPVEFYRCGANFDGVIYNVSNIASLKEVYKFTDETDSYDYYVSLCDDLPADKVPEGVAAQFGVNGVRVNKKTNFIEPIAFHDTQSYEMLDAFYPESGFVISTYSQSTDPASTVKFFQLTFVFAPGPDEKTDPISHSFFQINDVLNIYLEFNTKYAQPTKGPKPSPMPMPLKCPYEYDSKLVYPFSIKMDLANLNFGPHGFPIIFDGMKDVFALYQPCKVSDCPLDFDCGNVKEASAWVCYRDGMRCEGFSTPSVNFSALYEDPDEGIRAEYKGIDDNILHVDTICNFDLTDNQLYIQDGKLVHDSLLEIRALTKAACMQPIHEVNPEMCKAHLTDDTTSLDIDLTKYNQQHGYEFNVTNAAFKTPHWVNIQPCGALTCPADHCPTGTGATVYLCEELDDGSNQCLDYGLYKSDVDIEKFMAKLDRGVSINYYGNYDRQTHIKLTCNKSLPANTISFRPDIYFSTGNQLSMYAQSSDVCVATPAPTPIPDWYPPTPDPRQTNPPVQQTTSTIVTEPSVQSSSAVIFDLKNFHFSNFIDVKNPLLKTANAYFQYTPFTNNVCPRGMNCRGVDYADSWLCWKGDCYPMSLSHSYGVSYDPIMNSHETSVNTEGYFDTTLKVDFQCDETAISPQFDDVINFDGKRVYTIDVRTKESCPKSQHIPIFPPKPTNPTPKPNPKPYPIKFQNTMYHYDLSDLQDVDQDVKVVFEKGYFENVQIYMSFETQISPCPRNTDCAGVNESSAWKCWTDPRNNKKNCISMADVRYKPELVSENKIVYSGGYSNYRLTAKLFCGNSNNTVIDNVEQTENNNVFMNLNNKEFCLNRTAGKPSFAAVFLMIIIWLPMMYIAIGTLILFVIRGEVSVPHKEILKMILDYIATGVYFVFTCGRARSTATGYENI